MGFLAGKRALIVGLASKRSIAYGIAEAMHQHGAELAFAVQTERFQQKLLPLVEALGGDASKIFACDVADDQQIENLYSQLKTVWDGFDILVHAVAYAPASQLEGEYVDQVDREGFRIAHDISSYSLAALTKSALPMLKPNAAVMTVSYIGSTRTIPFYNTMGVAKASLEANMRYLSSSLGPRGIRVNAISAGPIRTLAASGIKNFRRMLDQYEMITPMQRNVTIEEVGQASAFICSPLASGITGEIIHVDNGFHMTGFSTQQMIKDSEAHTEM